jgi:hypothetical protein
VNLICFLAVGFPFQQDNTKFDHGEMPSPPLVLVWFLQRLKMRAVVFFICFWYIEVDACLTTTSLYWSHSMQAVVEKEIRKRGGADGHSISS